MKRLVFLTTLLALMLVPTEAQAGSPAESLKFACKTAGVAQLDPVVVPDGGPSAHLHVFTGNLGVPLGVHTYDEAIQQKTTCTFTDAAGNRVDTAAYWVPAMLDASGNVIPIKFVVYYDRMQAPISAFPPDFGMVWGSNLGVFSPKQRSYYGWNCDNSEPLQPTFANVDCRGMSSSNVVTFRGFSPYCWDAITPGRNVTGHVTYPVGYPTNQVCPAGSVTLPRLRVNANYQTFYNPDGRLSSDGPGQHGETAHTDFWNTWQQSALEDLVDRLNP